MRRYSKVSQLTLFVQRFTKEKFMRAVSLAVLLVASSVMAGPVEVSFNEDLQIHQFIEEVETPKDFDKNLGKPMNHRSEVDLNEVEVVFDQLVNLGKKVWALVENNKPVVNVKYMFANALPKGVRSAEELENFSDLQHVSYRVHGENLYGMTVYDLTYSLVHRYGGSYQGRGKFLENVAVVPSFLEVAWGYNVNYEVDKVSVVNTGSRENPVGSILLQTNFKVSTVLKSMETHSVYDFRGDSAIVKAVQR